MRRRVPVVAYHSGDEPSCAVWVEYVYYSAVSHLFSPAVLLEICRGTEAASCAGDERADDRQGVRFDGAAAEGAGGTVPRYEKSSACAFFHDW